MTTDTTSPIPSVAEALERAAELHDDDIGEDADALDELTAWCEEVSDSLGLRPPDLRVLLRGPSPGATMQYDADVWRREAMRARAEAETNRRRWVEAAEIANDERARRHATESSPRGRVFGDISAERERQDAKWGPVRKQPNVDPELAARGADHDEIAAAHFIPTAELAKRRFEELRKLGRVSFTDIVVEELAGAVEVHDDPVRLREELVQTAASVVKWIEALDLPEVQS